MKKMLMIVMMTLVHLNLGHAQASFNDSKNQVAIVTKVGDEYVMMNAIFVESSESSPLLTKALAMRAKHVAPAVGDAVSVKLKDVKYVNVNELWCSSITVTPSESDLGTAEVVKINIAKCSIQKLSARDLASFKTVITEAAHANFGNSAKVEISSSL